jgi:uncharacterized membrane protein YtjA (UPF0391 family)
LYISRIESFKLFESQRSRVMLRWSVIFLILALLAAVLGFGGLSGVVAYAARDLSLAFLVAFGGLLMAGMLVRR